VSNQPVSPVVTLTPAPTLDRTYFVHDLVEGGVNRADGVNEELAGKGINVSRALRLTGMSAPGVVPIGNADPGVLARTGSIDWLIPLWVDGTLRVSTTIVIKDGATTKINEGPRPLSEEDWTAVVDLTERAVRDNGAKWLVVAGALPVSKATGEYVDLTPVFDRMDAMGVKVAIDTSGEPLNIWARSGRPAVMKPNTHELAAALGRNLLTIGDVIDAGRELCEHGVQVVLCSMGADGLLAITKETALSSRTNPVKVINTVGAGDSTLAGFLSAVTERELGGSEEDYGVGFDVRAGVIRAVQWGALKVTQSTSGLMSIDNPPEAFVNLTPDRAEVLKEPATV
jgi:1-phosphofructokinase